MTIKINLSSTFIVFALLFCAFSYGTINLPCAPCYSGVNCDILCENRPNYGCCDNKECYDQGSNTCCGYGDGKTCLSTSQTCCNGGCCNSGEYCCDSLTCYDLETEQCCNEGNGLKCLKDYECCKNECCDPNSCESCVAGSCEDNLHCSPCWIWKDIPSNYIPDCPDCDNSEGCYGDFNFFSKSFSVYTGETAEEGEFGLCEIEHKLDIVGYHVFCIEKDTNLSEIIAIISAIDDISGYLDCINCLATLNPDSCVDCLFDLIADELIDDLFPCLYIGECGSCPLTDPSCAPPIELYVIDWEAVDACDLCYGG